MDCIEEIVTKNVKTKGEFQLTDALGLMLQRGEKIKTFNVEGWYDCGKPETLLATNRHLLEKKPLNRNIDGVVVVPPVFIAHNAKISNSMIGPYTTIAEGAVVSDSIIRNSIVGEEAQVSMSLLDNSIIGSNAVVKGTFKRINVGDSSEIDIN